MMLANSTGDGTAMRLSIPCLVAAAFIGASDVAIGKTLVLTSAVEGRLVQDASGKPASGVTVRRSWTWGWNGREGAEETVTDSEGRFRFGEVTGRSLTAGILPHEPGVRQEIAADLPGGALTLLSLQKSNYDRNGELNGRPLRIMCRADLEPDARGFFWGTCSYDD